MVVLKKMKPDDGVKLSDIWVEWSGVVSEVMTFNKAGPSYIKLFSSSK